MANDKDPYAFFREEAQAQQPEPVKRKPFLARMGAQGAKTAQGMYKVLGNALFGSSNPPKPIYPDISEANQVGLTPQQKAILQGSGINLNTSYAPANPDVPQVLDSSGILPAIGRYLFRTGSNLGDINSVSISPQGGATVQTNKPLRGASESGSASLREAALKEVFAPKKAVSQKPAAPNEYSAVSALALDKALPGIQQYLADAWTDESGKPLDINLTGIKSGIELYNKIPAETRRDVQRLLNEAEKGVRTLQVAPGSKATAKPFISKEGDNAGQ